MNTYKAYFGNRPTHTLQAETLYAAKLAAIAHFKPHRKQEHMVSVVLTETAKGPVALHNSNADFG